MAVRLEGQPVADAILTRLRQEVTALAESTGRAPVLAVARFGDDPDAALYAKVLLRACRRVGLTGEERATASSVTEAEAIAFLEDLNTDPRIDAILLQTPLPHHLQRDRLFAALAPVKDVDGLTPENQGLLLLGRPRHVPATATAIVRLAQSTAVPLSGARVAVIGRSNVVGLPAALLFLRANATVTLCHRSTKNLPNVLLEADIVVVAAGTPGLVTGTMVKPGAVVIDAGTTMTPDGLRGDVDAESVEPVAGFLTPVPGGVGRVTTALLLENVTAAARELRDMLAATYNERK
ncbi:MAG: bifunctional 5,10-methylenetetrahydrofolate dehydrogenase/5,10-methenyltetrahydrofolate cyclohydrolase [Chloroflexi bacterium]|nr:bifunctional 5,10-methylenetetrahydrofolate dehydrogenase/5,10-methenyltetrahydrofolate cyclohydrolase [Chloroflexota bacterium]